jgi:hypothetical protein
MSVCIRIDITVPEISSSCLLLLFAGCSLFLCTCVYMHVYIQH